MVYTQPRIYPGEWDAQNSLGFWDTNKLPNLVYWYSTKEKKENLPNGGLWTQSKIERKRKKKKKRDMSLDLARELKRTMEHKGDDVTNCNCWTRNNPQRLCKRTGRLSHQKRCEDQTTALLRSTRILWRVLETCGDLLSL